MMLAVSMTVSHLYQNLKIVKGVKSLKYASQGGRHPPPPRFGGGDHLCPYGRNLIGSLVPVHIRSARSNTYGFLDPSLELVAFLFSYFNLFPIHHMILTNVACYGWFMVFLGSSSTGGSCKISVRDLFCFLSVFCDPGAQLSSCFTDVYLFTLVEWNFVPHSSLFFCLLTLSLGWTKTCLMVVLGLTTLATPRLVNIRCIFSVNEWTYGTVTVPLDLFCAFSFLELSLLMTLISSCSITLSPYLSPNPDNHVYGGLFLCALPLACDLLPSRCCHSFGIRSVWPRVCAEADDAIETTGTGLCEWLSCRPVVWWIRHPSLW